MTEGELTMTCERPEPLNERQARDAKSTADENMRGEAVIELSKRVLNNFSEVDRNWNGTVDGGELWNFSMQPENKPLLRAASVIASQMKDVANAGFEPFGKQTEASKADFERLIQIVPEMAQPLAMARGIRETLYRHGPGPWDAKQMLDEQNRSPDKCDKYFFEEARNLPTNLWTLQLTDNLQSRQVINPDVVIDRVKNRHQLVNSLIGSLEWQA
jgi:hypothetical protein